VVDEVVAGALIKDARILLCHRSPDRQWYPDVWDLPGGHIEPGESPAEALKRELLEEVGVTPGDLSPEPFDRLFSSDFEMSVWRVLSWVGTPCNRSPEEHDAIEWFGAAELASLTLAHPSYPQLLHRCVSP
jgi:8-oxo-dGTP diphosphatase